MGDLLYFHTDGEVPGCYVDPDWVDPAVVVEAIDYVEAQHSLVREMRTAEMPEPPWPDTDNPMLRYLLQGAEAMLKRGTEPREVLLQALVHGWSEGFMAAFDTMQAHLRALQYTATPLDG